MGALVARSVDGATTRVLTPGRDAVVMRGLETTRDGSHVLATVVDDDGHHVLWIPFEEPERVRTLHSSPEEVWFAHVSADATLVCADTTEHNPGVRRPAVTVFDVATGDVVGVANDLPDGPIRAVRFSEVPGDQRVLISTERTGYARPAVWDAVSGARRDYDLPELPGEALGLGIGHWRPREHTPEVARQMVLAALEAERPLEAKQHLRALEEHTDALKTAALRAELARMIDEA